MKCPKCLYIGFETGDRCKNCGYDFSLLGMADDDLRAAPSDLPMRQPESAVAGLPLDLSPALGGWTGPDVDRFREVPHSEEPAMMLADPAELDVEERTLPDITPVPPAAAAAMSNDVLLISCHPSVRPTAIRRS